MVHKASSFINDTFDFSIILGVLACSGERYGVNCSETCCNCKHKTCISVSGNCRYGCKPDWKGGKCTQGITYCMQYINGIFSALMIPQKCILWI